MNVKISEKDQRSSWIFGKNMIIDRIRIREQIKFSEAKALFQYILNILPIDTG